MLSELAFCGDCHAVLTNLLVSFQHLPLSLATIKAIVDKRLDSFYEFALQYVAEKIRVDDALGSLDNLLKLTDNLEFVVRSEYTLQE